MDAGITTVNRLRIALRDDREVGYEILVGPGLLGELPSLLAIHAPATRYAVVADTTVAELYGAALRDALEAKGLAATLFRFPAGEGNKSREVWGTLTDAMLGAEFGRDSCVVAVGGGVTGDVAGFVAATYMRGLPLVQVPTTLLAMVDASIGGKVGVDTGAGKNLVGAFHHPHAVFADPRALETLTDRELRSGLAEAVKHGAIADEAHLHWIHRSADAIRARHPDTLSALVLRSVEIKAGVVTTDPLETGARTSLNFGHTIGHAVEALTDYAVPHGFAVAIGMVAEAELGESLGVTAPGTGAVIGRVLSDLELPLEPPSGVEPAAVVRLARSDKKARRGLTRYTLLSRLGGVARTPGGDWTHAVEEDRVIALLDHLWSGSRA